MQKKRLGVGFVGSGFIARFHMRSWVGVRDGDVVGVWSPNRERAEATAAFGRSLDIGPCRTYRSIAAMVADPEVDAIWLLGPNQARIENVEEIVHAIEMMDSEQTTIASAVEQQSMTAAEIGARVSAVARAAESSSSALIGLREAAHVVTAKSHELRALV